MKWTSELLNRGTVTLPDYSGVRVLMMPFHLHDPKGSLPESLQPWVKALRTMVAVSPCQKGTGYLTIDEATVQSGRTHRRPGLHVDGWAGDAGDSGVWSYGGGWGAREGGMVMATNILGSVAYEQNFDGEPKAYGDCEHLRSQCGESTPLVPGVIWWLSALTVHESIPHNTTVPRQFIRISMPSNAGWPASNTANPLGILPTGPVWSERPAAFTRYGDVSPMD